MFWPDFMMRRGIPQNTWNYFFLSGNKLNCVFLQSPSIFFVKIDGDFSVDSVETKGSILTSAKQNTLHRENTQKQEEENMSKSTTMDALRDKLEGSVGVVATKLANQKHIASLKDGMMFTLPFTLLGGICMILMYPPIPGDATEGFLAAWKSAGPTFPLFALGYYLTLGILAVYSTAGVAYSLAKSYDLHPGHYAFVSMAVFLTIACPETFIKNSDGYRAMALTNLDASGIFAGIVVAMVTVSLGAFMTKHRIMIRMPDAVPQSITACFEVLLPLAVSFILFTALNSVSVTVMGYGLVTFIASLIGPILSVSNTLPSVILINVFVIAFWFFGIHGAAMMASIVGTLQASNLVSNAAAIAEGLTPEFVLAGSWKSIFGTQIMYEALLVAILIVCRSARLRSLGKVALVPNIFNINEPLIFGMPLVMNITMIIPVIICTILNTTVSYLVMSANLVNKVYISTLATMPSPINAFLSTLDFRAVILWFILFAANIVIFLPFMRVYDKQVEAEDAAANEEG